MISYSTVVSTSTVSLGLKWADIPELDKNAPKPPRIDGMTPNPKRGQLRIQRKDGEENGSGFVPRKQYMAAKLNVELRMFAQENAAHTKKLKLAELNFRAFMENNFKGAEVFTLGSYPAGVHIHSSDLDYTVKLAEGGTAEEQLVKINALLENNACFKDVLFIPRARVKVIKLVDSATGVDIDVTVDNEGAKRNTQLLAYYSQMDERVSPLCRAVKNWAAWAGVENSRKGRLNSFTICMMVIHYLQSVAIVPCIQKYKRNLRGDCEVVDDNYLARGRELREELERKGKFAFGANKAGVGVLFAGFMKYYAEFNYAKKWISIKRGIALEKQFTPEEKPRGGLPANNWLIVVEDPFLNEPYNCAQTIYAMEYKDRIVLEIQRCHERIESTGSIFSNQMSEARRMLELETRERDRLDNPWGNPKFYDLENSVAVAYREKIEDPVWPVIYRVLFGR